MTSDERRAAIQGKIESFLKLMQEDPSPPEMFSVEPLPPESGDDPSTYRMMVTVRPLTVEHAEQLRELGFEPKE